MKKVLLRIGGIIAIPFLSLAGFIFIAVAVTFPTAVIVLLVSDFEYQFNIFLWSVPSFLQLPIAIIFGIFLFIVGRWLWKCLGRYMKALR